MGSGSRLELRLERVEEVVELFKIAKVQKVPVTAVKQAADLFREFGTTHGSPKEWRMVEAQFRNVIRALSNKQQEPHKRRDHDLDVQVRQAFLCADTERLGYLDFSKFAFWLSNNSFSEELNLDRDQKEMRNLARKHGLPVVNIERYKRAFREFDQDSSGGIDPEEFENLICKCGKVPQKSMPASRVQQWWRDADSDGNGIVDFEEFLVFQRKYFDLEGNGGGSGQAGGEARRSGFENYYRGIRKHCWT